MRGTYRRAAQSVVGSQGRMTEDAARRPHAASGRLDAGDLETIARAVRARRLGDPGLERELFLEVGRLAVLEGDVFALEQLDEDLDEAGVELGAGGAAELV